ncbi:hypothetical protein PsYK624_162830 [Phanerochaete sordida]|uniref:F-box domain-containing protein n=1 Tax=Phanerochaete sordida TaxID=48140 RepID=A0A9P3GVC8_9APHY|nr:hypothetical protein PsYK624_162830 [Phanerochaete sordida]
MSLRKSKSQSQIQKHGAVTMLNNDVIACAMEYLDLPELSRAMATCRALYDLGIPILLRDVQLVRSWRGHYQSRFALYRRHLLKNPARFALIRSLSCPVAALDDRIRTLFRALPRNFTSIRSLEVDMNVTEVDGYLASWVLSLENLRSLKLVHTTEYSPALMQLLQRMGSKLEELHIGTLPLIPTPTIFHPLQALAGSAHTLRSLSIQYYFQSGGPAIAPEDGLCFRAVEELSWTSAQNILVSDLVSTFPTLRKLCIKNPDFEFRYTVAPEDFDEDAFLQVRTYNRHVQNCSRMRWKLLERLEGDPITLWVLGLRCRVTQLRIGLDGIELSSKPGYTLAVLHDTWPEHLVLTASTRCSPAHLERILSFPSLRKLDLTFRLMESGDCSAKVHALLIEALQQMCGTNVRYLRITVELWLEVFTKMRGGSEVKRPQPKRAFPALWRAKVPQILEAFPALVELEIDIWKSHPFVWKRGHDEQRLDAKDSLDVYCRHEDPICPCAPSEES